MNAVIGFRVCYGPALFASALSTCSRPPPDPVPSASSAGVVVAPPGATGAFAAGRSEPPAAVDDEPEVPRVPDGGTPSPGSPSTGPSDDGGVAL